MRPPQPPQRPMVRPTARPVLRLALMELLLISGEARRFGRADPVEGNCHADHPLSPDEPSPCRCFPSEPSLSKRLDEEGRSWSSWQPQVKGRTGEAHITPRPVGSQDALHSVRVADPVPTEQKPARSGEDCERDRTTFLSTIGCDTRLRAR